MAKVVVTVKDNKRGSKYSIDADKFGGQTTEELVGHIIGIHVQIAKQEKRKAIKEGFDLNAETIVDNKLGLVEENVKPFGKIEYVAKVTAIDALLSIYREIYNLSPYTTGQYYASNLVFYNNILISSNMAELIGWVETFDQRKIKTGDQFRFVNSTPYAGKLEAYGTTKLNKRNERLISKKRYGKKISGKIKVKRENGVYFLALKAHLSKDKTNKKNISYEFMQNGSRGFLISYPNGVKSARDDGSKYYHPSIVFNVIKSRID